jgi:peptide chain release factor subunit 1
MITFNEIKELSSLSNNHLIISLYLNVHRVTNPKNDYIIHFKNMVKEEYTKIDKKKIEKDIKTIESYLRDSKPEFKKGLALITSSSIGLWREYHLALPVKNELIISNSPYLKPLVFLLNNYQRCAVLLVDRELARFFIFHVGEITEHSEIFTPDIPGQHKKGGWFSLQQKKFERHIEYHVSLHMKDVIRQLDEFISQESIKRILIGGPEDAVVKIQEMLPRRMLSKDITTFHVNMKIAEREVLDKTMKMLVKIEQEKEEEVVEQLITGTLKRQAAVIGIEDVLLNLQEGRVMELVFLEDLTLGGYSCKNCGYLTIHEIANCPYCAGQFEKIGYIVDFAVQKAVELGARIEVIKKNERFKKIGGIGAFLRF